MLARAQQLAAGWPPSSQSGSRILGLLFLEPSLRTRLGFASAAARLGWHTVEVYEPRCTAIEHAESLYDTIRVASGYCDVLIARPGRPLTGPSEFPLITCSLINGGDTGPDAQHPSQALIDLFAIEQLRGPIEQLAVAIVGDVRMRAARSLLCLLEGRRPRQTLVVTHPTYVSSARWLADLPWVGMTWDLAAASHADVVYVAGMPHDSIPRPDRSKLVVTERFTSTLTTNAAILSPMPVLDEVDPQIRDDPRMRFHEQSDLATFVRVAILEFVSESA